MLLVEKQDDADGRGGLLANTAVCSLGAGLQGPVLCQGQRRCIAGCC
jgi:hypothetical protein